MISLVALPKNHARTDLSAASSPSTMQFNLPQAQVQLKASVTSGRLASLRAALSTYLLKISGSLIKNSVYYNIPGRVPKNNAKANLSAASSQRALVFNLPQAKVQLKASVRSGRLASLTKITSSRNSA